MTPLIALIINEALPIILKEIHNMKDMSAVESVAAKAVLAAKVANSIEPAIGEQIKQHIVRAIKETL